MYSVHAIQFKAKSATITLPNVNYPSSNALTKKVIPNLNEPVTSCVYSADSNPEFKVTLNASVKIEGVIMLPGNWDGWTLENISIYVQTSPTLFTQALCGSS